MNSFHTREALVLQASFLREDLPYFAELLAEVVSQTRYTSTSCTVHNDLPRPASPVSAAVLRGESVLIRNPL